MSEQPDTITTPGGDGAGAAGTIDRIATVPATARRAGVQVVYLQNGWDPDYVEAGGTGSPNRHKSNALKHMRKVPDLAGQFLARGGWDYALVDALTPQSGDISLHKTRYSASIRSSTACCARAASAIGRDRTRRVDLRARHRDRRRNRRCGDGQVEIV